MENKKSMSVMDGVKIGFGIFIVLPILLVGGGMFVLTVILLVFGGMSGK